MGGLLGLLFIFSLLGPAENLALSDLQEMEAPQRKEAMERIFRKGTLPANEESAFVTWAIAEFPDQTSAFIRQYPNRFTNTAQYVTEAALFFVKHDRQELGIQTLSLARELYPNDPDVLGTTGIILINLGRAEEALEFLEEATVWRVQRPLYDFYLGGLLIQKDDAANKTRGKKLLMRAMSRADSALAEPAGLILLTDRSIPLLPQEIPAIYTQLEEVNTFRPDNPLLRLPDLRVIINRTLEVDAKIAAALTEVLLQFEEATTEDELAAVMLFQRHGFPIKSAELIQDFDASSLSSDQSLKLENCRVIQSFLDGAYESGMDRLRTLVDTHPEESFTYDTFTAIFSSGDLSLMGLDIRREVLVLFLQLPQRDSRQSLWVLSNLKSIAPLREKDWHDYAAEKLLNLDPTAVTRWLIAQRQAQLAIDAFATRDSLNSQQALAYFEALFQSRQIEQAEEVYASIAPQLAPVIAAFLQLRLSLAKNEQEQAAEAWRVAYQLAFRGQEFPLIKNLGLLALPLNQPLSALEALYTAMSSGIQLDESEATTLLRLTLEHGDMQQTMDVATYLADTFEGDAGHINNLAYLKFLQKSDIETHLGKMRQLVDDNPSVVQFQLTLAFGLLQLGRANEANRILQQSRIDWRDISNRGKLVYALILVANDQRVAASALLQSIDEADLITAEKALLRAN